MRTISIRQLHGPHTVSARYPRDIVKSLRHPRVAPCLPLAIFFTLSVAVTLHAWMSPQARIVGSYTDPYAKAWFLGWLPHELTSGHFALVTNVASYPAPVNLMWNNSVIALATLLSPITVGAGPVVAFNLAVVLGLTLSAWSAGLTLRRFIRTPLAAWIGGGLYGFSPFILGEAYGGQLPWVTLWTVPLLVCVLDALVRTRHGRPWVLGIAIGCLASFQILTTEELFATVLLTVAASLVVLAIANPRSAIALAPRVTGALLVATLFALAVAGPFLVVQFLGAHRLPPGPVMPASANVVDLLGWLVPTQLQLVAPSWLAHVGRAFPGYLFDRVGYVGLPLLVLAGWGAWRRRRESWVKLAVALVASLGVLSMGPHLYLAGHHTDLPMPWLLVQHLPLMEKVLPARLLAILWLPLAALAAAGLEAVLTGASRLGAIRAIAVTAVAVATILPAGQAPTLNANVPSWFTLTSTVSAKWHGAILVTPIATADQCRALLWQAAADYSFTTPSGCLLRALPDGSLVVGPTPSALVRAIWTTQAGGHVRLSPTTLQTLRTTLRHLGVDAVVAGPGPGQVHTVQLLAKVLSGAPTRVSGVYLWMRTSTGW